MSDLAVRLAALRNELQNLKRELAGSEGRSADVAALEADLDTTLCSILARYGSDLITVLDEGGVVRWATPNVSEIFGWHPDQMIGTSFVNFVHREDADAFANGNFTGPVSFRFRMQNGLYHWVETRPISDAASTGQIVATRDINAHFIAKSRASDMSVLFADELERMALTDSLTLLPNRRSIERVLDREISRSKRSGTPVSVVFFDIDRFKAINDTYGHVRGDEVLRQVGQQMANALRPYDFIGRWGGDEFLVVLPDTDGGHAVSAARRLSTSLALESLSSVGPVTISGGVAQHAGEPVEALVDRADRALYRAKGDGRNRIEVA